LQSVLAIETSQRTGGVALRDRSGSIHVETFASGGGHDDALMPAIDRLVRGAGMSPADLWGVGISVGPGGFTGLRIAVTTAKMLALTLDVRIAAVPSALVVAESCDPAAFGPGPILVALAAKRETFWSSVVIHKDGAWTISGEPSLVSAGDVVLDGITAVIADEFLPEAARGACAAAGVAIHEPRFDPRACLIVGARMLEADEFTDPLALVPVYPRPPEAVRLWKDRQG